MYATYADTTHLSPHPVSYATEGGRRDTPPPHPVVYATEGSQNVVPTYVTYVHVCHVC